MPDKDGSVELLRKGHLGKKNLWDQPVVGWIPTSQGLGGLFNPRGFAMLRVVINKFMDGVTHALYDQPIIIENPGAIIIAQLEDKVCLVQNFRMVGERLLPNAGADYIKRLNEGKLWGKLLSTLGAYRWEAPRGLAPGSGDEDMLSFILRSAKLEALEEAGLAIVDARIAGRVNTNSTFFAHAQYVVFARIAAIGESRPENLEIIKGSRLFTMAELRQLNDESGFDDGSTLAALALCGLSL